MTGAVDPRRTPWRADLAADWLSGSVVSNRFVPGVPRQVQVACADLRPVPDFRSPLSSQLLYGEVFVVYHEQDGWAWGQNSADGYVGYVRVGDLRAEVFHPTHRVCAVRSFLAPAPGVKVVPTGWISLGAMVSVVGEDGGFAALADGKWIFARHLMPGDLIEPDFVGTARRLLGIPYLWGGRSTLGLDCSGLVQTVLQAAGRPCPRDSDMQCAEVGTLVLDADAGEGCQRGDLVFFPGHVGIMISSQQLLHANAFTMTVTVDALVDVTARAGGILAVRRLAE